VFIDSFLVTQTLSLYCISARRKNKDRPDHPERSFVIPA
jgi:hypothetical protein